MLLGRKVAETPVGTFVMERFTLPVKLVRFNVMVAAALLPARSEKLAGMTLIV